MEKRLAAALAARVGIDADAEDTRARLAAALAAKNAAEQQAADRLSDSEQRDILLAEAREKLAQSEERASRADKQAELLNQQVAQLRRQMGELQALLDDAQARDVASQVQLQNLGSELNAAIARVAQEENRRRLAEGELRKENKRLLAELLRLTGVVSKEVYGKFEWRSDLPEALFFNGEITKDDHVDIEAALEQHSIDIIVLNSPGGNLLEGIAIADVIHNRGIATYVPVNGECISACVYIFFAGLERILDGRLKVHAPLSTNNDLETTLTPAQLMEFIAELNGTVISRSRKFEIPDSVIPLMLTSKEVVDVTSAIKALNKRSSSMDEKISSISSRTVTISRRLSDINHEFLSNLEGELSNQRVAQQVLFDKVVSLETKTESLESEKSLVERQLKQATARLAALREEIDRLNATLSAARARDTRRDTELAGLRKALAEAEARAATDEDDIRSLEERLAAALAARVGIDADTEDTRARLAAALAAKKVAEQQLAELLSDPEQRNILLIEAREKLAQSEERASRADKQAELLNQQVAQLRRQMGELQALLDDAQARDVASQVQLQNLGSELNAAIARVAQEERRRRLAEEEKRKLEEENRNIERYKSEFFGRLRDVLGRQEGVRVVGDRFVFSSEVLFEPGRASLSPAGQREISKVARILRAISDAIPPEIDWIIRVDGHTDNVPIPASAGFEDHWELSQARALSVVRYMITALDIDPQRLSANGFGEYQPVSLENTPEARAQNRRIELKLTER